MSSEYQTEVDFIRKLAKIRAVTWTAHSIILGYMEVLAQLQKRKL